MWVYILDPTKHLFSSTVNFTHRFTKISLTNFKLVGVDVDADDTRGTGLLTSHDDGQTDRTQTPHCTRTAGLHLKNKLSYAFITLYPFRVPTDFAKYFSMTSP